MDGNNNDGPVEPVLVTPPRSGPQPEDRESAPPDDQARSNDSSRAEQDLAQNGAPDSGGEGRGHKHRPPLPRPEGTVNCPRCTSAETKFCYYNNYNVKQPRYFCKASCSQGRLSS